MKFTLSSLSYDFGQRRVNANIQGLEQSGQFAYISLNFAADPPADISAIDLNDYLLKEVRRQFESAGSFELAAGYKK